MRMVCVLLFLLPVMGMAQAQTVLLNRVDAVRGQPAGYTQAVLTPQVEAWNLFWNTEHPDLEIGRLWQVSRQVRLGGYAVAWPNDRQYFLLPWIHIQQRVGSGVAIADLADYLPLNGGPNILFSNEGTLLWPVSARAEVGLTSSFRWTGTPGPIRYGPTLRYRVGRRLGFKINLYPFSFNGKSSERVRIISTVVL